MNKTKELLIQKNIKKFSGLITRETAIFMLEKEKEFGEVSE